MGIVRYLNEVERCCHLQERLQSLAALEPRPWQCDLDHGPGSVTSEMLVESLGPRLPYLTNGHMPCMMRVKVRYDEYILGHINSNYYHYHVEGHC